MYRCQFISSAVGGLAATGIAESTAASTSGTTRYRAAVIGHTGLGNYGHQWNVAWQSGGDGPTPTLRWGTWGTS